MNKPELRKSLTTYLLSNKGFISGVSAILDRSSVISRYNTSFSEDDADKKAIFTDWIMTGNDLKAALKQFCEEK